jgi:hypothetical protein
MDGKPTLMPLGTIGVSLCWSGVTIAQVRKLDGIRVLPMWSRSLMVVVGGLCVLAALLGHIR